MGLLVDNGDRRRFLTVIVQTAGAFLLGSLAKVVQAEWPKRLFAAQPFEAALSAIIQGEALTPSPLLELQLPETAEDGASVPLLFSSTLSNLTSIYILVEKNPTPLIMQWPLPNDVLPYLGCRIKMAESCQVWVVARQEDKYLYNRRWVNVMKGGCGTG